MKTRTILVVVPYGFNERMANFPEFNVSRLLAKKGWRVIGLARREKSEEKRHVIHGIDVYRYRNTAEGASYVLRVLLFERPSAVHVHMLRNNRVGILAAMLAKLLRIPLAFSEAGLLHDHYLTDDRDDPLGKPIHYERVARHPWQGLRSYFFHWPLMHADRIVFYSKHNMSIAERLGLRNTRYIPLIIDDTRLTSPKAGGGENRALPRGAFGLFVGQMKVRKGWDVLLRAIALTPREIVPKFVFVSSSSATETEGFATLVESLHVRDRVQFLGRASNAELWIAYERSSLIVVPSRYEGFGLVPLEAFEVGKPVIASRVEALTDFLEHGKNACLFPANDAEALARSIETVLSDEKLRTRIVEGGYETLARARSAERQVQWLNFYGSLLRT